MEPLVLVRIFLTLTLIVTLILAGAWIARKNGVGRSAKTTASLRVNMSVALGPRGACAVVLDHNNRRFVLGVTNHSISVIDSCDIPADEIPQHVSTQPLLTFSDVLRKVMHPGRR